VTSSRRHVHRVENLLRKLPLGNKHSHNKLVVVFVMAGGLKMGSTVQACKELVTSYRYLMISI